MGQIAYIGCRTTKERNARGTGIGVYRVEHGVFKHLQTLGGLVNPSFQCIDKTGRFLYTIHGDQSEISACSIDQGSGCLSKINTASTGGINPVHLSIDSSNRWIFVANLQTGTVAVIQRMENGQAGGVRHLYRIEGKETDSVSHPHQVQQDNTGSFLVVSCQGRQAGFGQLDVFRINHEDGSLTRTCVCPIEDGIEPRHVVFHENNRFCYGVNEKDASVTQYEFDAENGTLRIIDRVKALPDGCKESGWASGIVLDYGSRFLIVSNRNYDSIACFKLHQDTGALTRTDFVEVPGRQPRFICMTPENRLLVANEVTDTIMTYEIDSEQGTLALTGEALQTESPVCVTFHSLKKDKTEDK